MKTQNLFHPSDRYQFDFGCCSSNKGYAQIDTSQDASYFGTWANPFELIVVTYCEGDVTIQHCDNNKEFATCIESIKAWNECNDHEFKGIDAFCRDDMIERFTELNLGELLH